MSPGAFEWCPPDVELVSLCTSPGAFEWCPSPDVELVSLCTSPGAFEWCPSPDVELVSLCTSPGAFEWCPSLDVELVSLCTSPGAFGWCLMMRWWRESCIPDPEYEFIWCVWARLSYACCVLKVFFCYRLGGEINKVQKLFVSESCLKCRCDRCCSGVVQRRQKEMEAAQPEIRHLS